MNINLMNEFIEFSKNMNVSDAAKSLFVSQSTLSKHLKAIENEVGAELIDRSRPSALSLTEAGRVFLNACSTISHTYNVSLELCHELAKSPEKLSILRPCTIDASNELVYEIYRNMQKEHEEISLSLLQMGGYSMMENLMMGRVDCATSHIISEEQEKTQREQGIALLPLLQDNVYAWGPREMDIMKKGHLHVSDLRDVPIFVPASRIYMDLHEWYEHLCMREGFKPLLTYRDANDMYELMNSNLEDGVMVLTSEALMGDPVFRFQKGMVLKPLEDDELHNTLNLAYLQSNENPALEILIDCVKGLDYGFLQKKGISVLV